MCRRLVSVMALFLCGLAVKLVIGAWGPASIDPWAYRFALGEMMLFAAGGISYFGGRFAQDHVPQSVVKYSPVICLAILVIAIVDVPYITPLLRSFVGNKYVSWLLLWYPGFLLLVAFACPALFNGWRKITWDSILGELSYPIYISHLFVFEVLRHLVPEAMLFGNLLYVASVVAFSSALFLLIGLPVDQIRAHFGARVPNVRRTSIIQATDVPMRSRLQPIQCSSADQGRGIATGSSRGPARPGLLAAQPASASICVLSR